ncbi:MAG: 3-deoxy-8-phosphooctulonate synthase [Gammaproteobacteria bacterium]
MNPSFAPGAPLFLIAGPCALESRELAMRTAERLRAICAARGLPLIFKGSFDKANRTSGDAGRGAGMDEGLRVLEEVRREFALPVLTDVHWPAQAETVAAVADVLQIPAFLCRQTDLIAACAKSGRAVNIKKGQFLSPREMLRAAAKAESFGAREILLCERGASFGYNNLVADMRSLVVLRESRRPVVFDATHSAQLPGAEGGGSGGQREMILPLARAAAATGIDGIFVETHPDPRRAISDSATQWPLDGMDSFLAQVLAIDGARRAAESEFAAPAESE